MGWLYVLIQNSVPKSHDWLEDSNELKYYLVYYIITGTEVFMALFCSSLNSIYVYIRVYRLYILVCLFKVYEPAIYWGYSRPRFRPLNNCLTNIYVVTYPYTKIVLSIYFNVNQFFRCISEVKLKPQLTSPTWLLRKDFWMYTYLFCLLDSHLFWDITQIFLSPFKLTCLIKVSA